MDSSEACSSPYYRCSGQEAALALTLLRAAVHLSRVCEEAVDAQTILVSNNGTVHYPIHIAEIL